MAAPILEAVSLKKHFPVHQGLGRHQVLKAVDGVNLRLFQGETLGLAGESGCGKSTVGRLLMDLMPPTSGHVAFRGARLDAMSRGQRFAFRKEVQMIFQDPYASLNPRMRIGDIIGEALKIHGLTTREQYRDRVLELMHAVGLRAEHFPRYPHEFSGGQRQRVGIARALAVSPKVIIADEPVSALDLSIQAQIMNILQDLQRDFGLSYIFIAHDLAVVRHMSTTIAVIYLGRIVEIGPRDQVFLSCLHPYTEALISAIPRIEGGSGKKKIPPGDLPTPLSPPPGCPFHPRCPYAEKVCSVEVPALEEKEPGHYAACHFSRKIFR